MAAQASAAQAEVFDIPAGRLADVAVALGVQSGTTIILAQPGLATVHSPGVRGDLPLRSALKHILRGTDAQAVQRPGGVWQIRRRRSAAASNPPSPPSPPPPLAADIPNIVVTASKQNLTLDRYPGSVKIVEPARDWIANHAAEGTAAITRLLPALSSTNLGNGRNKLFIRGIADSSFTGPTQATTGQFLGDIRLTYNTPDPDLHIYDMKRIEVLTGPQGTLYGTSSLGGIVRMVPNDPDASAFAATAAIGAGTTRRGGPSMDGAAMINLPIVAGQIAARLVSFGGRTGGYIDAPLQGRRNINHVERYGNRLSIRAEDVGGWTIGAGTVFQNINGGDGQYVLRGDPPFTRTGLVPQPFENNYRLGYISFSRSLGRAKLVSVTSLAHHHQTSLFDPARFDGGLIPPGYAEKNRATLFYHETRLSSADRRAPWTAGVALTRNINSFLVTLNPADRNDRGGGRRERQTELSLFGQLSYPLTRTLTVTGGARLTSTHGWQGLINIPLEDREGSRRSGFRFSGTAGLNWNPAGSVSVFYHYQQGYRPGGLGIFFSGGAVKSRRFAADELDVHEVGVRWGSPSGRLSGQAALFSANWNNIQADLIGESVTPFTANIGRGTIEGLDFELSWRPSSSLTIGAAAFLNDSRLVETAPGFPAASEGRRGGTLPNVARNGARIAATWRRAIGSGATLKLEGAARYIGRSYLGLGRLLDIAQGDYWVADASAYLNMGRLGLSFSISNVTDSQGNSFSYGNPFGMARRDQITPLRPRSVRLGADFRF